MGEKFSTDGLLVSIQVNLGRSVTGGVYAHMNAVTANGSRPLGHWESHGRALDPSELADMQSSLCQALAEYVTITSGVQLILHD